MVSAARLSGIFIMFFDTFLPGLVPFVMFRLFKKRLPREKVESWIGLVNSFTGGVFLGTAILHLMSEAREQLTDAISYDYPVTEAIVGGGLLMTLIVEQSVRHAVVLRWATKKCRTNTTNMSTNF
jgi:hypothetical protein